LGLRANTVLSGIINLSVRTGRPHFLHQPYWAGTRGGLRGTACLIFPHQSAGVP